MKTELTDRQIKAIITTWADCGNDFREIAHITSRGLTDYKFPYESDLTGAIFKGAQLYSVDFNRANMQCAHFDNASLANCDFSKCCVMRLGLKDAYIIKCCFTDAYYDKNMGDEIFLWEMSHGTIVQNCDDVPDEIRALLCEECGRYCGDNSHIMNDTGRELCPICCEELAFYCDFCGSYFEKSETESISDDNIEVCERCYNDHFFRCGCCGGLINQDDGIYDESRGDIYCLTCYNELHEDDYNYILGYHEYWQKEFRGMDLFKDKGNPLYLGFECEAGGVSSMKRDACAENIFNPEHHIMMEDGSIDDYGFELISHPWSLDKHIEDGWGVLKTMSDDYKMKSYYAYHCGLHVHVSRNFLKESTWDELGFFVNKYKKFFIKVARRECCEYAEYSHAEDATKYEDIDSIKNKLRYSAVNFRNETTVEFRMFKGTLNISSLLATLELCHGLCYFFRAYEEDVENGTESDDALTLKKFKEFLKSNEYREYKYVNDFIIKCGAQNING